MILTSKKFDVNTSKERFGLYLSQHDNGVWFAGVVWYRKAGSWAEGKDVSLDFDLKTFSNTSKETVFEEAVAWVRGNLDQNANIVPA
jgi:hypothetical protein